MHYTGPVFRPPFEAKSLLLEVTVGCSHNACAFCAMYRCVQFQVSPMEQIVEDLLEARETHPYVRRVYLVNGDPFVLSADRLKEIAAKINEIFPEVETIAMYASIKNIMGKTDEELKELRALKINDLNIGVESGMDSVLKQMNKGVNLEETRTQLLRLNHAGIDFSANIILGAAGEGRGEEHARACAELLNEVQPKLIALATLHLDDGSPLNDEVQSGEFLEDTYGDNVKEEIALLKYLDCFDCKFFGLHNSNAIPIVGNLLTKKEWMEVYLQKRYNEMPERVKILKPNQGQKGVPILLQR